MYLLLPHRSDSGMGKSAKRIPFALSVSCCAVTAAFPDLTLVLTCRPWGRFLRWPPKFHYPLGTSLRSVYV
jgi:hypothetical protein